MDHKTAFSLLETLVLVGFDDLNLSKDVSKPDVFYVEIHSELLDAKMIGEAVKAAAEHRVALSLYEGRLTYE